MAKQKDNAPATQAITAPEPTAPATKPQVPALQASSAGLIGVPPIVPENYPILTMESDDVKMMLESYIGAGGVRAFDLPRLRIPGSGGTHWKVETLQGSKLVESINAVVLYWRPTRAKWDKEYGKAPVGPPQCKSDDGITGKGNPGGYCQKCPLKDFGANGEKPLCKNKMMLFVLPEGERVPWVLFAPTMSIPPMQKYFLRLMSAGVPTYFCVSTALGLTQDKNTGGTEYSLLSPTVSAILAGDHLKAMRDYVKGMRPIFESFNPTDDDLAENPGCRETPAEVG